MTLTTVIKIQCSWIMISSNVHSIRFVRFHSHIYLHRLRLFCLVRLEASVVDVLPSHVLRSKRVDRHSVRFDFEWPFTRASATHHWHKLNSLSFCPVVVCVWVCWWPFAVCRTRVPASKDIPFVFILLYSVCATLAFSLSVIMCRIGKIKTKMIYLQAK